MWISVPQLVRSLEALEPLHPFFGMAFLAFKENELPVGQRVTIGFAKLMRDFLTQHYKPSKSYKGYYNPFRTSDPSNRWLTEKYPSGALQRITVDTFGAAIIHKKNDRQWGWQEDYVEILQRLQRETNSSPIPVFHLAVWIFRNDEYEEGIDPSNLISKFCTKFRISPEEEKLVSLDFSSEFDLVDQWLVSAPATENDLLAEIGWPPGETEDGSVRLNQIKFKNVGPAAELLYEPSRRINIITGDNSVGKTFLLDTVWWALTGNWIGYPAFPNARANPASAQIEFELEVRGRSQTFKTRYVPSTQAWEGSGKDPRRGGLAIYARHDGSFISWDTSLRTQKSDEELSDSQVSLTREELFYGKEVKNLHGGRAYLCNGLLYDWVQWQTRPSRYDEVYSAFLDVLKTLSPSPSEPLVPDEPMLDSDGAREVPSLKMPYGATKITLASAGVQRVVGLAYFIVWAWFEHLKRSNKASKEPQKRMVLLVDEVEAHLHPKWQRVIVPAFHTAIRNLSNNLSIEVDIQAHIATHSPLVLASAEPIFDDRVDSLHHLHMEGENVTIENVEFQKFGSVDAWLTSDIFGLRHARSKEAEISIERAKQVQLSDEPSSEEVQEITDQLRRSLSNDDKFWPRWLYFAEQHGVKL